MHRILLLIAVALGGCSDQALHALGDDAPPPRTEGSDDDDVELPPPPEPCTSEAHPAEHVGTGDTCSPVSGGFDPVVKWAYEGGGGCLSLPVVGDLDGDGSAEVVVNVTDLFSRAGDLVVLSGASGTPLWTLPASQLGLGYAASPALGDVDGDGQPEVVVVREYASSMFGLNPGEYSVVALDRTGAVVWESQRFDGSQVDYQSAPVLSDMDHDGAVEVVVGRAILRGSDGSTRGLGAGSGSFMLPAVADLDLDGVQEVVGGDAWYDADGATLRTFPELAGGMVAIADLDDDGLGEALVTVGDNIRALNTDGSPLWGPITVAPGQLASAPAVGDIDRDGRPEIVVAGGSALHAFNHDGTVLWTVPVVDETGATGASIFDFEGDGQPEVAYVDEVSMTVFDGATGAERFATDEHSSNTMWEYPVIADVDADGHAEAVVCHNGFFFPTVSVFEDAQDSWAPARPVWNQHAYAISNVGDDLSIPTDAEPSFVASNTFHAATATTGVALGVDFEVEIVSVCGDHCDSEGLLWATVRLINRGIEAAPADVPVTLYAYRESTWEAVATVRAPEALEPGWASAGIEVAIPSELVAGVVLLEARADDAQGLGEVDECSETNNRHTWEGALCD